MSQEIPVTGSMSFTMGTRARVNAYKQIQIKKWTNFCFNLITSISKGSKPAANAFFWRKIESVSYQ